MKKWAVTFALVTALVYITLSISAAACLFTQQSHARTAHHHTAGGTHSPLCAWACQANQTVELLAPSTQPHLLRLVTMLLFISAVVPSILAYQSALSRAPPRR